MPASSAAMSIPIFLLAARAVPMAGESPYEIPAPVVLKISATALRTDGWVLTHFSGASPTSRLALSRIFSSLSANLSAPPTRSIPF